MKATPWLTVAGTLGALGVAIGAFGAHVLPAVLASRGLTQDEIASRLEMFHTGVRYHMYHAIALLVIAVLARDGQNRRLNASAILFLVGIGLFSGLLYAYAITGVSALGRIVPIGGIAFVAGWSVLACAGTRKRRNY